MFHVVAAYNVVAGVCSVLEHLTPDLFHPLQVHRA